MTAPSEGISNQFGPCTCGHAFHPSVCHEAGCNCLRYLRNVPMPDEVFRVSPIFSENNWTEQDLRKKLSACESHLRYHNSEAERYRSQIKAIQDELGTLPVAGQKKP